MNESGWVFLGAAGTSVPTLAMGTILFPNERLGKINPYECQTNIYVFNCEYCKTRSQSGDVISSCPKCGAPNE